MSAGELERIVKIDRLPSQSIPIEATEAEREALAKRFAVPSVQALRAEITLVQHGESIDARGRLLANIEQRCGVSGDLFPAEIEEPIAVRFVPALSEHAEDEEIEFVSDAPDEIAYDGTSFDLGEAVAQSFGLAIDPYPLGPDADVIRREVGLVDESAPSGPFAALAAFKKD